MANRFRLVSFAHPAVSASWTTLFNKELLADHLLFDMGMDSPYLHFCVRTGDEQLIEILRAGEGRSLFEPHNPTMAGIVEYSPTRVAVSRLGRVEVYQPIPAADGTQQTPPGPHTHVLPQLLTSKRTHAATSPIPAGLIPCC